MKKMINDDILSDHLPCAINDSKGDTVCTTSLIK